MNRTGINSIVITDLDQLLIIQAVLSLTVVLMVLLQLAGARLPAQICFVDSGNQQVHLVTRNVLQMQIAPPLNSS